jgi:Tfp pilus assembly protein PilX
MLRLSARSIWLQAMVVLVAIIGVIAGDVTVAQARVAANHRKEAARKLHRAEAAYVAKIDAISRQLFNTVQPVQNALDHLDASRPELIDASRDAVVNSATSSIVTRLDAQLMKTRPTRTFATQHAALHAALTKMNKSLVSLERGKKSKDASDLLDEPYSGAAFNLSDAEDSWEKTLRQLDVNTHRVEAPSPGSVGSKRPRAKLTASKASWIFAADRACSAGGHAVFRLPDPGNNPSDAALVKFTDRFSSIIENVSRQIRTVQVPARDHVTLQRGVLRSLRSSDAFAQAFRQLGTSVREHSISIYNDAITREHAAEKGLSTLSRQMTAYGAEECGAFFDPNAKPTEKNGGSSGVSA